MWSFFVTEGGERIYGIKGQSNGTKEENRDI